MDMDNETMAAVTTIIIVVADLIAGKIPDKYFGYIGIIRRIMERLVKKNGTEK
jgi:hypothetical protein